MLSSWSNFFALTGSAGATLLGLLFVVVTLGTNMSTSRKLDVAHASLTPALYSFAGVLAQSMVALVPWHSNGPVGVTFGVLGTVGLVYRVNAVRMRKTLHLSAIRSLLDRIVHNALPILASLMLILGGASLYAGETYAPYFIAGASAILLVSGIYRAWGETLAFIGSPEVPQDSQR